MNIDRTILPGITAIFTLPAEKLPPYLRELADIGITTPITADITTLPIGPGATARTETQTAPEGNTHKTTLRFITDTTAADLGHHPAFIIVDASGAYRIIGAREAPYPKITVADDLSTPGESKAGTQITVEWTSPMMPCNALLPSF